MKIRWHLWMIAVSGIALWGFVAAESFVINKKKPQKQSMNKLKENYADELAELVRIIPGLQKQLADLQERLINELYSLLDNDVQASKVELDSRICKAQELRCFLEQESSHSLSAKSSFIRHATETKKINTETKSISQAQ